MIIVRPLHTLSDVIARVPQHQLRQLHTHLVGVVQYGFVAMAMFSVSAVAGVVAGVAVGLFR